MPTSFKNDLEIFFYEGKSCKVIANSGMIDKGTVIVVTRVETAQLYVEKE